MIGRLAAALRHPLGQAVALLIAAYLLFRFGIPYLPPLFGIPSAPVPRSILLQYLLTTVVAVLIYLSSEQERWERFQQPLRALLVEPRHRPLRRLFGVLLPLAAGAATYQQVRPQVGAPPMLRSIHPASPSQITFHGKTLDLATLENPLRAGGDLAAAAERGKRVYYQNCLPCHGDLLDGRGHFAHGFNPTPLPFDNSTIAQLRESFVFWRIAKGGPGLPREGAPWNSAMPVWEDFLNEEEIWSVIVFLYQQSGMQPRRLGAEGGGAP